MSQSSYLPSKIGQSMLNGALVIGMVNNYFSESKKNLWSFGKARNVVIEKKIKIWAVKNIFPTYSEVQKNSRVVDV